METLEEISEHILVTKLNVIEYQNKWKIINFSFFEEEIIIESPIFCIGPNNGLRFCLLLYPNGYTINSRGYASLVLKLISTQKSEILGKIKFFIETAAGDIILQYPEHVVHFVDNKIACENLLRHAQLFKKNFQNLKDEIIISFSISIGTDIVKVPSLLNSPILPELNLIEQWHKRFVNKDFGNVDLIVEGKEFHAHKFILSEFSKVFKAMFEHKMEESETNRVNIKDIDSTVFEELLYFMYTGTSPNLTEMAYELFLAADIYDVEPLKLMCEEKLCSNLSIETAADVLKLSAIHNVQNLKKKAIDFISIYYQDVIKTNNWKDLSNAHPEITSKLIEAFKNEYFE